MKKPTLEEWKQLYEAASQFKKSQCWTWMYDGDLFAVEDPETGEISYCSIMGNAGQLIGLVAYTGPEGLQSLTEILLGQNHDLDFRFNQKCLMYSYGNRNDLETEDLKVIKSLGLKFRGRGQWPEFRDYSPGLLPWFIDGKACRLLTVIIYQALDVAERCKESKDFLTDYPDEKKMLVRVKRGSLWEDEYKEAQASVSYLSIAISDELLLRKLKKFKGKPAGSLEIDTFYCPAPIAEKRGDRPYFPQMCLIVDRNSGMVLGYKTFKDLKADGHECLDGLIETITQLGALPSQIFVRKEETYYLFKEVCKQLEIELVRRGELQLIEGIKDQFFDFMG